MLAALMMTSSLQKGLSHSGKGAEIRTTLLSSGSVALKNRCCARFIRYWFAYRQGCLAAWEPAAVGLAPASLIDSVQTRSAICTCLRERSSDRVHKGVM